MNINDLKKLNWEPINDWSSLPMTNYNNASVAFASKEDIKSFITDYTHIMARKYNIEYDELNKLLTEENTAFYSVLDCFYKHYSGLGHNAKELKLLKQYFKVPCFPTEESDPVSEILIKFERLTDIQKADVLARLNHLSIRVVDKNIRELR